MISIIFAFLAGVSIVLSRSINGFLATKIGAYPSTFYNYFTGLIGSIILWLIMGIITKQFIVFLAEDFKFIYLLGGIIGIANIVILNIVVAKILPLQLTLIVFTAQLFSGLALDYLIYDLFSVKKVIGCILVCFGLFCYQTIVKKEMNS